MYINIVTVSLYRFEEAFQKALRMVDECCNGFEPNDTDVNEDVSIQQCSSP